MPGYILYVYLYLIYHLSFLLDLPYDSLISCASTSKAILHDALPLVSTLHIGKAAQLRIGVVSKQLRDICNVSICNLFSKNNNANHIQMDEDIATNSVHFLLDYLI